MGRERAAVRDTAQAWRSGVKPVARRPYPLLLLPLPLGPVLLPLLLHVLQELLVVHQELFALLGLPRLDLGL